MAWTMSAFCSSSCRMNRAPGAARPRGGLPAVERGVQLLVDRLELGHAAAVEQQAERGEHLLDLRRPGRCGPAGSWSPSGGGRGRLGGCRGARRTSRRAGWSGGSRRSRCRVGRTSPPTRSRPRRASRRARSPDLADRDVVDLHGRLRYQVEHVDEVHPHGDPVGVDVRSPGQRQLVRPSKSHAGGQHRQEDSATALTRFIATPLHESAERPVELLVPGPRRAGPGAACRAAERPAVIVSRTPPAPLTSVVRPQRYITGSASIWPRSSPSWLRVSSVPACGL